MYLDNSEGLNLGADGLDGQSYVLCVSCNTETQECLIILLETLCTETRMI